jgi:hypothetical protein
MSATLASLLERVLPSWDRAITKREVQEVSAASGLSVEEVLNSVALQIAHRFHARLWSHGEAMGKCAALYDAVALEGSWPKALYEVYWALDEAEQGSEQDGPGEDAAENRSRRCVQVVLESFAANDA